MRATDSLQQEPGHFCLPVKLCLGHSELLLSLGRVGHERENKNRPPVSLPPPSPAPLKQPRSGLLFPSVAAVTSPRGCRHRWQECTSHP